MVMSNPTLLILSGAVVKAVEMAGGMPEGVKRKTEVNYHGTSDLLLC